MKLTHAAAAAVFAAVGLGLAAPAVADTPAPTGPMADPHALGTFAFEAEDGERAEWTVTPCADDTLHCVYVVSTGNSLRKPWSGHAYWTVGSWIMFVDQPDAILCSNGVTEPGNNNYSWDATTFNGYASINTTGSCGTTEPASVAIPFTLTKTGEPPRAPDLPVDIEVGVPAPIAEAPAAQAPAGAMPAEQDPSLVATPNAIPNLSDPLTEAVVAEPGFNAVPGGGGHGR